jgi:putative tryptophan/tyrosine transport system substrate-binding protein
MGNDGFHPFATRRRWLAVGVAWPAWAWTGAGRAQTTSPVLIGWLDIGNADRSRRMKAEFNEGMAALGWKLGAQYLIEARHADGLAERLPALAQELAARKPAIIVASPSAAARAATAAAPTTPIVMMHGDPLAVGLVASLSRPGGMITGVSNVSADAINKVVEFLIEAMPRIRRVGFLVDSSTPGRDSSANARKAAERLSVEAVVAFMARPEDIEPAMVQLAQGKAQAVVVMPSAWFSSAMPAIIQSASLRRWPVVGSAHVVSWRGGLLSYAPDHFAQARRVAHYVDRILKGAKPGDLPIEQPTAIHLVLNLKTAATLGIVIPPAMRLRATEVIE